MGSKTKPDKKDAGYQVPKDIRSFTITSKKVEARKMLALGEKEWPNEKIAEITGLKPRAIGSMRGHLTGKLKPPPNTKAAGTTTTEEPDGGNGKGEKEGERITIHTIDPAKPKEVPPTPEEQRLAHVEGGLIDVTSRIAGIETSVGDTRKDLASGIGRIEQLVATALASRPETPPPSSQETTPVAHPVPLQQAQGNGEAVEQVERSVLDVESDVIVIKVPTSVRRIALFDAWKAKQNKNAREFPKEHDPVTAGMAEIYVVAFDYWMRKKGGMLVYQTRDVVGGG